MNTPIENSYNQSSQILLGLENLYPEKELIPKIRFALETLTFSRHESEKVLDDFFVILKTLKSYPVTPHFENLNKAKDSKEIFEACLKILDHLSYDHTFEEIRLIVANLNLQDDSKGLRNLIISFLNERSKQEGYEFCSLLVGIILEEDAFTKLKKILEFYIFLYDDGLLVRLKKAYEHYVSLNLPLQFYAFLHDHSQLPLLDAIKELTYKGVQARFHQAFSKGQVQSKMWALKTIKDLDLPRESAVVLCGWYGVLPYLLLNSGFQTVVNVDIDPHCEPLAQRINHEAFFQSQFQAVTEDIFNLNYENFDFQFHDTEKKLNKTSLLINTSCEHIPNFAEWYSKIPEGQLLLLQTNDFFSCEEHVNCVNSTAEFRDQTPMSKRLFSGALPLEKYTRYMVIGYK